MIQIHNLTKSYGTQILFENLTFTLNRGEKVGLIGRNGSGKTTLFRLILGLENFDKGNILIPKGYRIGYLKQHIHFTENTTVKEACLSIPKSDTGTDETYKAKKALRGLGFVEEDFQTNPNMLSGGFQIRLNLAKTLLEEPDLLLLDEPTNYLDIVSIRWIRHFLKNWNKELIIITHDRDFMDSVTTHTMAIHRNKLKKIEGNSHKLYEQIILEEELYEQTRINDEKKRKEVQEFIDRFRAKATKARQVQSRIKALQKRENLEQLRNIKNLDFEFSYLNFHGRSLIDVQNISFSYDNKKANLIEGLSITISADDRIAIIGKNGKGKSTLLNLLAGELMPTQGSVVHNPKLSIGYFGQTNVLRLNPHRTVTDEIMSVMSEDNVRRARTIAGIMMFDGDNSLKKINILSGGEKSRVLLGKIICKPSNLLLLDEPTNHLDMESVESLLEAIEEFPGAVVIVTHTEMILKSIAKRLIVFDGGSVKVFEGGYEDFLNKVGWLDEEEDINEKLDIENTNHLLNRKELKRKKAELINTRSRILMPIQNRIKEIEETIYNLEEKNIKDNEALLIASEKGDWQSCYLISETIKKDEDEIVRLYDELYNLTDQYNLKKDEFQKQLDLIEGIKCLPQNCR